MTSRAARRSARGPRRSSGRSCCRWRPCARSTCWIGSPGGRRLSATPCGSWRGAGPGACAAAARSGSAGLTRAPAGAPSLWTGAGPGRCGPGRATCRSGPRSRAPRCACPGGCRWTGRSGGRRPWPHRTPCSPPRAPSARRPCRAGAGPGVAASCGAAGPPRTAAAAPRPCPAARCGTRRWPPRASTRGCGSCTRRCSCPCGRGRPCSARRCRPGGARSP
mmetsp:Transcript_10942/g.33300  ORF Transcript_10942/g.33300 Transcript_10942/m.33300 type:complete len:220 (+) Transcript_10942:370-1029(+)